MIYIHENRRGFEIRQSDTRGGKAGRGKNLTTSLQVVNLDGCVLRYVRYRIGDEVSQRKALDKAHAFIDARVAHYEAQSKRRHP